MGQLRSAVRALASTGLEPAALLDALDGFAARHRVGQMTTVAYAQFDVAGRAALCVRGAPAARCCSSPAVAPCLLWDGRSVPLDALAPARPRDQGTPALEPGGTVLLYTDGLVERRAKTLDVGLERLLAAAGAPPRRRRRRARSAVVRALRDGERRRRLPARRAPPRRRADAPIPTPITRGQR